MSRKLRIEAVALAALLVSAACFDIGAHALPQREPAQQAEAAPVSATPPEAELRQQTPAPASAEQPPAPAPPEAAPAQQAAATPAPNEATPARVERMAEQSAPPARANPRFKVEAVGFRAVDESGANYPDADFVFAVFESQQHTMTTRVFEDIDTGDARIFDAAENCIFPARDVDGLRNGAWACSAEGGDGPVTFAVGLYEIDPDYIGAYTEDFCTPAASADVDPGQRNCDTDNTDLMFRSAFSYQSSEILRRLEPGCRCVSETVRFRESSARGYVEYHLTFRITRTDAGGAPPAGERSAGRDVHRSGARSAALGQGFELDGGLSAAIAPDLTFSGAPAEPMLAPAGGAKIWPGDANARGFDACYAERRSANYVTTAIAAPAAGQYACYVTNNGRIGELRIDNLTTSFGAAVLSLSYTTWQ